MWLGIVSLYQSRFILLSLILLLYKEYRGSQVNLSSNVNKMEFHSSIKPANDKYMWIINKPQNLITWDEL